MTTSAFNGDAAALVRPEHVHRFAYTDPEVFAAEQERIFGRLWLYVAHESQLKKPGDFVRARMGTLEVVTRHTDGAIHVLHNKCPHRGARLCMADHGNSRVLSCPYHAWTFRSDGTLASVPHSQSYPPDFDRADPRNAMARVPLVDSYRGYVFANLNADAAPLLDHLGEMTETIDNLVDRAPAGEVEICEHSFEVEYRGNWKLHMENAADIFHPTYVHSSSVGPARRSTEVSKLDNGQAREMMMANGFGGDQWEGIQLAGLASGHTYMTSFYDQGVLANSEADPMVSRYRALLAESVGEEKMEQVLGVRRFNNIIYPNFLINALYQQIRVAYPIGPDRTLVKASCFRLVGAPDEMFRRTVRFMTTLSSPASMIFTDDVEMLERCQQGMSEEGSSWINFSRGAHADTVVETPAGEEKTSGVASEMPMRVQFAAWARYMTEEPA